MHDERSSRFGIIKPEEQMGAVGTEPCSRGSANGDQDKKGEVRNQSDSLTTKSIMRLIESQDFKCALTHRKLTPSTASLDHRVPVARGGPHVLSNCQVLDKQVNRAKGTMTTDEFISLCREVVAVANASHKPR